MVVGGESEGGRPAPLPTAPVPPPSPPATHQPGTPREEPRDEVPPGVEGGVAEEGPAGTPEPAQTATGPAVVAQPLPVEPKTKRPKPDRPPPILDVETLPPELETVDFRAALRARLAERSQQPGAPARQSLEQIGAQLRQLAKVARIRGVEYAVDCLERATSGHHQAVVFPDSDYQPAALGRNGNDPAFRELPLRIDPRRGAGRAGPGGVSPGWDSRQGKIVG